MNLREKDLKHIWHPYTEINGFTASGFPVMEKGEGVRLFDHNGRGYLDGISSWWCVNLGHGHPDIVNSIARQSVKLQHSITGGMSHTPVIELAELLSSVTPVGLNRFYFASDGASAVEAALRIAVQYWWNLGRPGKKHIISLQGAYHGDTLGTAGLGFIPRFHAPVAHVLRRARQAPAPHCFHCPEGLERGSCSAQCFHGMEDLLRREHRSTAAVIAEPLCQGAAGIRIYNPRYISRLRDLCSELDILLILDEIAVGFGRTGAMFASEVAGVSPDLLVMGKSLTGGYLPMSAVAVTESIFDSFRNMNGRDRTFYHGHTFAGNPIAAAAAAAAVDVFSRDRIIEASCVPERLSKAFNEMDLLPGVHMTDTLGSMSSLEISSDAGGANAAGRTAARALQKGLLIRPLGPVLYLWPPLTATSDELAEMTGIFQDSLRETLT